MTPNFVPFGPADLTAGPVVPRDAATVMLVRDGPSGGLEILMLRKTVKAEFAGGAHVFPGGAVDPSDASVEVTAFLSGRDGVSADAQLGTASGGLAFWVAAVRECFEEAGILLAYGPDGRTVSLADPDTAARYQRHRGALNRGEATLAEICRAERLELAVDRIHYFSHWITPEGAPRRYDTRFFVAEAPTDQAALNDGSETVENLWISPADALRRGADGGMALIYATVKNLEAVARFTSAAELVAAARVIEDVPANLPRVRLDGREVRILLPGDPGYERIGAATTVAAGPVPEQPGAAP